MRDLLSNVLTVDPKDRLTIPQLKSHPWVLENMQLLASSKGRPASQSVEILEKYPPGHIAEMHTRTAKVAEKERQKYNERLNSGQLSQAPNNPVEKHGSSTANGGAAEIQPEKANAGTDIQPEKANGGAEVQPEKANGSAEVQPEKAAPAPPRPTRTEASQQNQDLVPELFRLSFLIDVVRELLLSKIIRHAFPLVR